MNVMRCLAGIEWGADTASLKQIYVSLIRSRMEYRSVVCGSASKLLLETPNIDLEIIERKLD